MDIRRRVSGRHEQHTAQVLGAKQHGGSGSGDKRNDGHTTEMGNRALDSGILFECKTVVGGKKQITLKDEDLVALTKRAAMQGRLPWFAFEVGGRKYVALPEEDALEQWRHGRTSAEVGDPGQA